MKIPKAVYFFLLVIIGIQVYSIVRNNALDEKLVAIQAAHQHLKIDLKNVMTIADSIILLNEKLTRLEHGKVDSLFSAVALRDIAIKKLQNRQYELKNEYKKVSGRLDSLGGFTHLPVF